MAHRRRIFLREWRKFRGLTLEKLAEAMDVSVAGVSRVERGERPYTQDFLEKAAVALECEPAELLSSDPEDGLQLQAIWNDIPANRRYQAIAILRAIAESADLVNDR